MAGVMPIGELGHAMETLLEAVVELRCELDRKGVQLLERGIDRLHGMVTRVGARQAVGMSTALIDSFNALAAGVEDPGDAPPAGVAPPKPVLAPLSRPIDDGVSMGDDDDVSVRAPQEQVRIRADLLDRLV